MNVKTNYEVTEEELREIRDLADTVADHGHKILFKIKCLGEENTLIDGSEFVYRGQDQMKLIRQKMANAKRVAKTFRVF